MGIPIVNQASTSSAKKKGPTSTQIKICIHRQDSSSPNFKTEVLGKANGSVAIPKASLEVNTRYERNPPVKWNSGPETHRLLPAWFQRSILALMLGGYVYYVVLPSVLNRPAVGLGQLLMKLLRLKAKINLEK